MRTGWLALPILVCAAACSPVKDYQEAARGLQFQLDRVQPEFRLALPLERSQVVFRVLLTVVNPSKVPFHILAFAGDLSLETGGQLCAVGHVQLTKALELPATGSAGLEVEVSFSYQDLRDNWGAIQSATQGGAGAWRLDGSLQARAYGLPLNLPVRTHRPFGTP